MEYSVCRILRYLPLFVVAVDGAEWGRIAGRRTRPPSEARGPPWRCGLGDRDVSMTALEAAHRARSIPNDRDQLSSHNGVSYTADSRTQHLHPLDRSRDLERCNNHLVP
ncbi:unnamed protein product [Chilo suppressalis]|uniref:Secreted protein n=1 Tax=Chilo suppressalis TaxID=168631 RepID=A0ABN8B382_CHISP|nr:unnamed protein product [Chilo suppressalis]